MGKTDLEFLFDFADIDLNVMGYNNRIFLFPLVNKLSNKIRQLIDRGLIFDDLEKIKKLIRAIRLLDYEIIVDSYNEGDNTFNLTYFQNVLNEFDQDIYKELFTLSLKYNINVLNENHNFGYHIHHLHNGKRTNVIFTYKGKNICKKKKELYIEKHGEGHSLTSNISVHSSNDVKKAVFRACGYIGKGIQCENFKQAGNKAVILWSIEC